MSYERGEAMERAKDRADEDRAAAEALAAALRELLACLPRCDVTGCGRRASHGTPSHEPTHCAEHWPYAQHMFGDWTEEAEQAEAALAAWEARGR